MRRKLYLYTGILIYLKLGIILFCYFSTQFLSFLLFFFTFEQKPEIGFMSIYKRGMLGHYTRLTNVDQL